LYSGFFFNIIIDFNATTAAVTPTEIARQAISYKRTSKIVHRGTLEVVWTIIPVLILTAIAVPSFELLYALDVVADPLLTIKCIGNQWYWSYEGIYSHQFNRDEIKDDVEYLWNDMKKRRLGEFRNWYLPSHYRMKRMFTIGDLYFNPYKRAKKRGRMIKDAIDADQIKVHWRLQYDKGDFIMYKYFNTRRNVDIDMPFDYEGDSYMLDADELVIGMYRLLETDGFLSLPTDTELRFVITATDVLHSFAIPALGIKVDAIPGRLNQFGMKVRVPGVYFGQCSELCGVGHGFMPIKMQFVYNDLHMR